METASAIFALLDTDHNGQLDFVEFIAAFGALNANDEVVRSLPNLLDKILVNGMGLAGSFTHCLLEFARSYIEYECITAHSEKGRRQRCRSVPQ